MAWILGEYMTLYTKRRNAGLCGDCGREAILGKSRCEICRMSYQKRNELRRASGLCTACGKEAQHGKSRCRPCLDRYNAYATQRMQDHLKSGTCIVCGKHKICNRSKSRCSLCLAKSRNSELKHKESRAIKTMRWRESLKQEVYAAYGGFICSCCGETEPKFLCLDHINNDGAIHRKEIGMGGDRLLRWIKLNGFPDNIQVICANCNQGKHLNNGVCPHHEKNCGSDDPMELAIALNWYDPYEDKWHDEEKRIACDKAMICKASGKREEAVIHTFNIGGMWEDNCWRIAVNKDCSELSGGVPCKHCIEVTTKVHTRKDNTTWNELVWICPRVVIAKNEGGHNSTGVCLDCIIWAASELGILDA